MTSVSSDSSPAVGVAPTAPTDTRAIAREPLPRRSFFTGRVLDPELHPPLRRRVARAMRRHGDV